MPFATLVGVFVCFLALAVPLSAAEAKITFSALGSVDLADQPAGDNVQTVAVADLNHDGRPDLIVVQPDFGLISVFMNDGAGRFGTPNVFTSEHSRAAVTTGDFNNDNKTDIAVINDEDDTVTAFLGNGDGTFFESATVSVDPGPVGLVAADFNNDVRDDIAVVTDTTVYLLKSNGDGTFSPFDKPSLSTRARGGFAIAAGRISNSHPYADLAVTNNDSDSVSIFFSNGDGTFQDPPTLVSGITQPRGLAIGQFNSDANADIAVVSGEDVDTTVIVLGGDGNGNFISNDTARPESSALEGSVAIAAIDLDGDQKNDFAVGATGGGGSSGAVQLFCQEPSTVCFDPNPLVPLVCIQPPDTCTDSIQIQQSLSALNGPMTAVQAGDLNGDGKIDLVAVQEGGDAIRILINTTGQAGQPTTPPTSGSATETPGTPTTATPTPTPPPPLTATPSRTPTPIPTAPYGLCYIKNVPPDLADLGKPVAVVTGDFNHDGNQDIAVADQLNGSIVLLESEIDHGGADACAVLGLMRVNEITDIAVPEAMATADLDRDGNPDLAVVGSEGLSVFFGLGASDFDEGSDNPMTAGTNPAALAIADFNRDGMPDIIVANAGSNYVSIFFNTGDQAFDSPCQIPVGRNANFVIARDLNGDGRPDFAIASKQTNDVLIFLQAGSSATPTAAAASNCPVTFMSLNGPSRLQQPQAMIADILDPSNMIPDLALAVSPGGNGSDGAINVFLGSSSASGGVIYGQGTQLPVPTPGTQGAGPSLPSALGSGDINRDGRTDLIVTDKKNNDVVIYLGNGNGSFATPLIPVGIGGKSPVALAVTDMDGDGVPDVVTANEDDGSISVLLSSRPPPTPTPLPTDTPTRTATTTQTATPSWTPTHTASPTPTATRTGPPPPSLSPIPSATPIPTLKPGTVALQGSCALDAAPRHAPWNWLSVPALVLAARWVRRRRDARRFR